jgi:hypothetical protein
MKDMPVDPICKSCGSIMKRNYTVDSKPHVFEPQMFEHIASEPIFCNSRRELREACKKNGVKSLYLEEGYNR